MHVCCRLSLASLLVLVSAKGGGSGVLVRWQAGRRLCGLPSCAHDLLPHLAGAASATPAHHHLAGRHAKAFFLQGVSRLWRR
jgi:hypothetical protein